MEKTRVKGNLRSRGTGRVWNLMECLRKRSTEWRTAGGEEMWHLETRSAGVGRQNRTSSDRRSGARSRRPTWVLIISPWQHTAFRGCIQGWPQDLWVSKDSSESTSKLLEVTKENNLLLWYAIPILNLHCGSENAYLQGNHAVAFLFFESVSEI